jgi:hypothetical protein
LYSYLIQTKIYFFKNGEQEGKTGPVWVLISVEEGYRKGVGGEYGRNIMHSCMKMEK